MLSLMKQVFHLLLLRPFLSHSPVDRLHVFIELLVLVHARYLLHGAEPTDGQHSPGNRFA